MRLNTIEFLLHEGWDAAVRNGLVTLAAISNVAVALLILGSLVLFGMNVEHMASLQAEAAVIVVELAEGADAAALLDEKQFLAEQSLKRLPAQIVARHPDSIVAHRHRHERRQYGRGFLHDDRHPRRL